MFVKTLTVLILELLDPIHFITQYGPDDIPDLLIRGCLVALYRFFGRQARAELFDVPQVSHLVHHLAQLVQRITGDDLGEHQFFLLVHLSIGAQQPRVVVAVLVGFAPYFDGASFTTLQKKKKIMN